MAIAVECSHCGKQMRVKDELAGRRGKCPQCQKSIEIPGGSGQLGGTAAAVKTTTVRSANVSTVVAPRPAAASPPASSGAAKPSREQIREQVLAAFAGKIAPPKVGIGRKLGALLVLGVLLLMPLFYLAVIGGLIGGMVWLGMGGLSQMISPPVFWAIQGAGGIVLLCLIKPLVERQRKAMDATKLDLSREPLLQEFLAKVCEQLNASPPSTVQLECSTRLAGVERKGVLTIGLPLMACLSVEQFAAELAGQLALVRRGAGCGVANLIRSINGWLWRSIYGRSRFDHWLALVAERPHFHMAKLLLPLRAAKIVPQVVLFIPMFIANTFGGFVVKGAELDADRAAVRLVGRRTFAGLLERIELVEFTWAGVLAELAFLHREQALPDSLPQQLALRMLDASPELMAVLRETVNQTDEKPFDTKASNPERLAALESERDESVLRCQLPATLLLADYEATAKKLTWDHYVAAFGPQLLKTGMKPVVFPQ